MSNISRDGWMLDIFNVRSKFFSYRQLLEHAGSSHLPESSRIGAFGKVSR